MKTKNYKLDQKGAIHFLVLALLLAGIVAGVFLVTGGNPLKFFSKATNPYIVFTDPAGYTLPTNSEGVPISEHPMHSRVANVRVELTSPLGPPSAASGSASVSAPNSRRTISFKVAEDPGTGLNSAPVQPYTEEPMVITHPFKISLQPCASEKRFLWVEFKGSDGSLDRRTAAVELKIFCPSVSGPVGTPESPTCTDTDGGRNYEVAGKTVYTNNPDNIQEEYDNCTGQNLLAEKVCNSQTDYTQNTESYECPYGCVDGACKKKPTGDGNVGIGTTTFPPTAPAGSTITQYRYAENPTDLQQALWQDYSYGTKVSYTFKDKTLGVKFIFIQFADKDNKIVQIDGQDYISNSIELVKEQGQPVPPGAVPPPPSSEEVTVGTASLTTDSVVTQRGGNWGANYINLTLSGFSTPGRSIAGLFVRNTVGGCSINDCGYIGWTQIRSYGTNGTDNNPWTAPSSLREGVHMFGVFSLNSDGTARKLLAVSASNFTTSGGSTYITPYITPPVSSCTIGKTCTCGDTTIGDTRNPGSCSDCNGGWCNGGQCASCGSSPTPSYSTPYNTPSSGSSCVANVTKCGCGDAAQGRGGENAGVCYPECNGGWCRDGICATCNP